MAFIPNPTPSGDYYRIIAGSMGDFLCPPGHPNHFYELRGARRGQLMKNPHTISSVESAASEESAEYLPTEIVRQARHLLRSAQLVRSELWERYVYSYFRNSYSADGINRNADRLLIVGMAWHVDKGSRYSSLNRSDEKLRADDPRVIPEHHAAYLLVKSYFPEADPRLDLIADASGGYGQKTCAKCGKSLQYEAKVDAFAEAITARLDCPNGGMHSIEAGQQP